MGTQGTSSNTGRAKSWAGDTQIRGLLLHSNKKGNFFVCLFKPTVLQIQILDPSLGRVWFCPPTFMMLMIPWGWACPGTQGWPRMFLPLPSPGGSSAQLQTLLLPEDSPDPMDSSCCKELPPSVNKASDFKGVSQITGCKDLSVRHFYRGGLTHLMPSNSQGGSHED